MDIKHKIMDTPEYKALFKTAKLSYPDEYDMLLHLACINYFKETSNLNIKSDINIDNTTNEVQEEHPPEGHQE